MYTPFVHCSFHLFNMSNNENHSKSQKHKESNDNKSANIKAMINDKKVSFISKDRNIGLQFSSHKNNKKTNNKPKIYKNKQ